MTNSPRRSLVEASIYRPNHLTNSPRSKDLLWLDKNENLDVEYLELLNQIHLRLNPKNYSVYPELSELYGAIAKLDQVTPDSLLLTYGSDGAIKYVFDVFVEHGDYVFHTNPSFAMYEVYCRMYGAIPFAMEYSKSLNGPVLNLENIEELLHRYKPKLFCLPNPDSPSGTVVEPGLIKKILKVCEETKTILFLDEAYYPFYPWTGAQWVENSSNLIVARTFSKAWGLAGLRVGYMISNPDTISLISQMRPMYEIGSFASDFVLNLLQYSEQMLLSVDRINKGKNHFLNKMQQLGFGVLNTYGNFIHVGFGENKELIHKALSKKVLYRHSFSHPCLDGYSRFTAGPTALMDSLAILITRIFEKELRG